MEEVIDDFIDKFWKSDRILELRKLAEENQWHFTSRQRFAEQQTALKQFHLFKGDKGKRITGILEFKNPDLQCDVRIYDYIYYSDGGKRKTTVIEFFSPALNIIPLHIYPRKSLASLFAFGKKTALEKFNMQYQVEGPAPELLTRIPDSVAELMGINPGLSIEARDDYFIYYFFKKRIPVQDIFTEYRKAVQILDRLLHDREKDFV